MSADCAAFDISDRFLLVKRNDNGLWALPGSLVEVGESPAGAATREARKMSACRPRRPAGFLTGTAVGGAVVGGTVVGGTIYGGVALGVAIT